MSYITSFFSAVKRFGHSSRMYLHINYANNETLQKGIKVNEQQILLILLNDCSYSDFLI